MFMGPIPPGLSAGAPMPPGMPGPAPVPPTMAGAPAHAGPGVVPQGKPGQTTQGLSDLKIALEAMQKALPTIPMGTKLHEEVLKSVSSIGKHLTEFEDSPQMKIQNLLQMIARARAAQPNNALSALAQGGPPAPPVLAPPPGMPAAA